MITVRNSGIVRWIIEKLLALVQLTRGSFKPGLPYQARVVYALKAGLLAE